MERRHDLLREWRNYLEEFVNRFSDIGIHLIDLGHHRIKMKDFEKRLKKVSY